MREDTAFLPSLLGGATERRYRRMRPEVEALPWGTLDPQRYSERARIAHRQAWTLSAFQEHRTAAACADTVSALVAAGAPLDLIAMATRFSLDELVHVELCARLANELGGGVRLLHDPRALAPGPSAALPPLLRAADLIVRHFCVGEAISVPLLRATWHATRHALVKGALGVIVKDEAAHGELGWMFLDWADDALDDADRAQLGAVAGAMIADVRRSCAAVAERTVEPGAGAELGWLEPREYVAVAEAALAAKVLAPLSERGLVVAE